MVKIAEISRTSTFAWSHDCLPLLATGTVAGAVDLSFSSQAVLEIWDVFSPIDKSKPVVEAPVDARFHAIGWSKPFDKYARGVIAGGFENGTIEFWDADVLLKTKDLAKSSIYKNDKVHSGFVKSLSFHPTQDHVLVSGGDKGQIFVWDLKTFAEPKAPGSAMTPMEIISSVAWNQAVPHIFASTAGNSGYTSIWDLKAKREVLHLSYQGTGGTRANFSCVAWHPTQSTKLVTASDNDGCPLILTWDLRNANAPEKILTGHTQGVLSLDWCQQDPEILISSGKDNSTMLWNPITGEKLGEYPTTANWAFQTKFAPQAPDIFATASFDGKIVIQSLQDTSPPVSSKVSQANDDNQFWNEISTHETQQPKFEKRQAPKWLKVPSSVSFGFGSKLVSVKTDANGKSSVEINKYISNTKFAGVTEKLSGAIKGDDFSELVASKETFANEQEKSDWNLLKKLSKEGGSKLLQSEISEVTSATAAAGGESKPKTEEQPNGKDTSAEDEDSFFDNLGTAGVKKAAAPFVPSGNFSIFSSKDSKDEGQLKLTNLILNGKIDQAVASSIEQGLLVEALILALDGSQETKELVKSEYFQKNQGNPLSRLLYSASSKNVTDIVANADVTNWKEIAASISSYATDKDDFNAKITELGDRILSSTGSTGTSSNRENALLCYLAGNAIDKISKIWLNELDTIERDLLKSKDSNISSPSDARFEALNIFVEKLAAYRSISNIKGTLSGPGIEGVCKVLLEYSNLVAGYGDFDLAEKFLELLPEDFAGLKLEKDRIGKATGKTAVAAAAAAKTKAASGRTASAYHGGRSSVSARTNSYLKSPVSNHISPAPPIGGGIPKPSYPPQVPGFNRAPPPPVFGAGAVSASPAIPTAAPVSNPYAPSFASNPYRPSGTQFESNVNTFTPPPPPVGGAGSIAPPPANPNAPPFKKDEGGWNDLPETFKPKVAPRTSSRVTSPAPAPSAQQSIQVPKRTSSAASAPVLPPPPKGISRTPSKQAVPTTTSATNSPSLGNPQLNSRYAPPPGASVSEPPSSAGPPASFAEAKSPAVPPKNPYAPTVSAQPPVRNAYAQPLSFQSVPQSVPTLPPTAPPKNPYAPQQANGGHTSAGPLTPQAGGIRSPPVASFPPPPPVGGGRSFPPPAAATPPPPPPVAASSAAASAPPPPPPAVPAKEQYPTGDRSHIPEESLPIYTTLNSILEQIMPDLPAQYVKHGEAVVRRLNILFDHLNNDDLLSKEVIAALNNVCSALKEKDYKQALALHLELTTNHSEETSNWHPGVKHLIQMAEALQ